MEYICNKNYSCCNYGYCNSPNDLDEEAKYCGHLVEVGRVTHGKWIYDIGEKYECSACGMKTQVDECMSKPMYKYCPYCGAKMKE